MAYSKQTWATGDTITAEKLNHMEDGIAEEENSTADLKIYLDTTQMTLSMVGKSFDDLYDAIDSGEFINVFSVTPNESGGKEIIKSYHVSCISHEEYDVVNVVVNTGNASLGLFLKSTGTGYITIGSSTINYTWTYDVTTTEYTCTITVG